jgi:hypothetical protein
VSAPAKCTGSGRGILFERVDYSCRDNLIVTVATFLHDLSRNFGADCRKEHVISFASRLHRSGIRLVTRQSSDKYIIASVSEKRRVIMDAGEAIIAPQTTKYFAV